MQIDPHKALVIVTKDGQEARLVVRSVHLSEADGTLINAPGMGRIVSAEGYKLLASAGGMLIMRPTEVVVNDKMQPNGYTDPETGDMYCRAVCLGYTPEGQATSSDRTIIFNAEQKKRLDLLTKAKNEPAICKMVPKGCKPAPKGVRPDDTYSETWACYCVDAALDIWIDTSKPEAIKWAIEAGKSREFGPRKGQTMAERNAIKAHPAIRVPHLKNLLPEMDISVTCWYTASGPLRLDGSILKVDITKLIAATDADQDARTVAMDDLDADDHAGAIDVEEIVDDAPPEGGQAKDIADHPADAQSGVSSRRKSLLAEAIMFGIENADKMTDDELFAAVNPEGGTGGAKDDKGALVERVLLLSVGQVRAYKAACKELGIDSEKIPQETIVKLTKLAEMLEAGKK